MSKCVKLSLSIFKLLCEIKNKRIRTYIIKHFLDCKTFQIAIREIAVNLTRRNIPLKKSDKQKLKKYRKAIYLLANSRKKSSIKKNSLQVGGFMSVVAPLLFEIFSI